jgi:hypothetical protein
LRRRAIRGQTICNDPRDRILHRRKRRGTSRQCRTTSFTRSATFTLAVPNGVRKRIRRLRNVRYQCSKSQRIDIGRMLRFFCKKQLRTAEIDLLLIFEFRLFGAGTEQ